MTVSELIAKLQSLDPSSPVLVDWNRTGFQVQDLTEENLMVGELVPQGEQQGRPVLVIG